MTLTDGGVIDAKFASLSTQNVLKIHKYFLHEISAFFHEPTILLRAMYWQPCLYDSR